MRFRVILLSLVLSLAPLILSRPIAAAPAPAPAAYKEIPTVCLQAEITIAATPARVWPFVTKGKDLVTWCPMWKSMNNSKASLTKVGDVLDYTDQWGNGGRSIVTYLVPDKEIRVAHEPNNGSYMCQAKLTLTAKGSSTLVQYSEQYTDSSSATDLAATAGKMNTEMNQSLAALKAEVEKK
jgi:uncharacterized protein YndB with AHSA1/START domain